MKLMGIAIGLLLLVGCQTIQSMPVPQMFDVTVTVTVCPDHTWFPRGLQRKEVGGCALPSKVWIKGHLVDGKVVPESMEVFGHEMTHILNFAYPGSVRNPDGGGD